jgi:hypothetical protein
MRRAYSIVLRFYPAEHRALFEREMLALIEEASAERRARGCAAFFWFSLRELAGLACGGGFEWIAKCCRSSGYLDYVPSGAERVEFLIRRMEYAIAHHQFAKARYYAKSFRKNVIETVRRWLKRHPDSRDPYARVRVPVRKGPGWPARGGGS